MERRRKSSSYIDLPIAVMPIRQRRLTDPNLVAGPELDPSIEVELTARIKVLLQHLAQIAHKLNKVEIERKRFRADVQYVKHLLKGFFGLRGEPDQDVVCTEMTTLRDEYLALYNVKLQYHDTVDHFYFTNERNALLRQFAFFDRRCPDTDPSELEKLQAKLTLHVKALLKVHKHCEGPKQIDSVSRSNAIKVGYEDRVQCEIFRFPRHQSSIVETLLGPRFRRRAIVEDSEESGALTPEGSVIDYNSDQGENGNEHDSNASTRVPSPILSDEENSQVDTQEEAVPRRGVVGRMNFETICYIGAGYVGTISAIYTAFYWRDLKVVVVDKNRDVITKRYSDNMGLQEHGLEALLAGAQADDSERASFNDEELRTFYDRPRAHRLSNLCFTRDARAAIGRAQVIFICIDTPMDVTHPKLSADHCRDNMRGIMVQISAYSTCSNIVVQRSTVPVGTAVDMQKAISSQAKPGFVHQVLSCPEFIKQGSPIKDLAQPHSRIIGSCLTKPSWAVAAVKRLCSGPESEGVTWQVTDTATAELTKLASNTLLAQRISNANAIADMCEHHGCDIDDLRYTLEGDARLNSSLATESIGFGGTCLRKDVDWMSFCFDQSGLTDAAKYWRDINHVNTSHIRSEAQRVIQQIRQETNNTDCAKVAILGFAFKKNTDEMKTSSAVPFVRELLKHGCHVRVYDPRLDQAKLNEILEQYRGSLPFGALKTIKVFQRPLSGPLGACKGAHAVVLHTPWEEFKITNFDWIRVHQRMKAPKVLMLGRDRINPHGWRALGFKVLEIGVVGPGEVLQHHD